MPGELSNGARVAIIGGGVAGGALAVSLLQNARARSRTFEVRIYEGTQEGTVSPPLVLGPECRSRLAGLGCRVPQDWRALELKGVEVISGGARTLLPAAGGTLWVVDRYASGLSGQRLVAQALKQLALSLGAKVISRTVDRVEDQPALQGVHQLGRNPGQTVVRAGGSAERFHAVALAGGADTSLGRSFFRGFRGAPTLPAAHARIRHGVVRTFGPQVARLIVAPLPGVDGLMLVPGQGSTYAIAYGPQVDAADLCQAVMAAARDGLVPEGFELSELELTRVPFGPGGRLTAEGKIAVGAAALGHPLQLGISETLASCTRASSALIDAGRDAAQLERRYTRDAMLDLLQDAADGARAVGWLRRAGPRGPGALERARAKAIPGLPFAGGILGLPGPSPRQALSSLRWAGCLEELTGWLYPSFTPLPASAVVPEPDLYYVVDDDPAQREALTSFLEAKGANVVAFGDELSLFAAVARRPPTAILLDVVLNWVDGLRLCEGLKRHPSTRQVPVYVMSGMNRPHIVARALEAGAVSFLPKPLDPAKVLGILRGQIIPVPSSGRGPPSLQAAPASANELWAR